MDAASFGEILSQFEQEHHVESGGAQVREGTVVTVTADSIFVDIGRKMDGVLSLDEYRQVSENAEVKPGDTLLVTIAGRDEEGNYRLSTVKVERPRDWRALEDAFQGKRTIAGMVMEVVKGGLRVDVGVRAFMPASRSGAKDQAELEKLVGQEIQCRITKLDTTSEDVVVDRRVVLEEEAAKAKQEAFEKLETGAVVRGTVRSLTDFGAFVDLGGFDGLLHVSDMSWGRVGKPSDVLSAGDSVEVKILKVDRDARKISLGLKQLAPDPWSLIAEKYKTGDRVRGKVVRVMDFGAFVELEPGVEGLVHLSEMSWSRKVRKASDVVKNGELVEVMVLGVSAGERRIALGLKQALGDPWEEAQKKYAPGAVVEAPITGLTKFGAFVELGDGIEGMIHIGDISREKRLNHPNEVLSAGQKVRAQVLELDKERRRLRLGMKQLEPTTVDEYIGEHRSGEIVSGRVVETREGRVRVELGEGVVASCRLPVRATPAPAPAPAGGADLAALTAMLSAKWKSGARTSASGASEPLQAGQVRRFRITQLVAGEKRIELELAD